MSAQSFPGQPGWFTDPTGKFEMRYWDGGHWTQAVMRDGTVETDPAGPPAAPTQGNYANPANPANPADYQAASPPPQPTDRMTSLSPADAQGRVGQMLAMSGTTVNQGAQGRLDCSMRINGEPNVILLVVLILFWIIPGAIYWYAASRPTEHRFSLYFVPVPTGTRIAVQAPNPVMDRLAPVLAQLPW